MSTRITNEENKRQEFKDQIAQKVAKSLTPKPVVASAAPIDVEVPSNFFQIPEIELFGYLHQTLSSDQTIEVIEQLMGRVPRTNQFRIVLKSPVAKTQESTKKIVKEIPVVKVDLPNDFSTYRKKEQFAYLTRERALSTEQANDIIDIIEGKDPIGFSVYELSYSESVKFPNPIDAVKPKAAPISVTLSHDFGKKTRPVQEYNLVRDYGFSLVDARDIISVFNGQKVDREVTLTIEKTPEVKAAPVAMIPEIEIELPYNFAGLRPQDQFMFLKTRKHLTEEQANDVLITFKGGTPLQSKVTIKESTDRPQEYVMERTQEVLTPIEIALPHNFKAMKRSTQEMLLTKGYELSLAEARDVISAVSLVPTKRSVTFTIEDSPVVEVASEKDFPEIIAEVPESFGSLNDSQKYTYLVVGSKFTSHEANDVIAAFNGKTPVYHKVTIIELADESSKFTLPEKVEAPLNPVKVLLPLSFKEMKRANQELVLTTEHGLTLAEARDVLLTMAQKATKRVVEVAFEEAPVVQAAPLRDFPEIIVELPETFGNLIESQKYAYLTVTAKLTSQQASDVLAAYAGKTPVFSKVIIKEI